MTQAQLLTYGAIGFAAFALYQFNKKPTPTVANQPGQRMRDMAVTGWYANLNHQETEVTNRALGTYLDELARKGIL